MAGPRDHVTIIGLNYPPEPTGIAPYTGALVSGLSEAGYHVTAHVAHPHYPEWTIGDGYGQWTRSEVIGGVRVTRRLHYVPRSPRGVRRLLAEISFGVRLLFARWGRPRVVVAVSPSLFSTALVALRVQLSPRRGRFIVWVQDLYTLGVAETGEGKGLVRWITKCVESLTLRAADSVVVIHDRFKDFVVGELGIPTSRVQVVRNWTHLPRSTPVDSASARRSLGWPENVTLAVHTGNMGAKQGLENVVDAARVAQARGEAVHFMLVGDGGERRDLEERASGIAQLTFVDPLDDVDYRLALSAADVLLVNEKPGVAAMAVPSKLTSYFDAGRPIVAATDLSGITAAEVAAAQAGVTVRAGDPSALVDVILDLAADTERMTRLGKNGREFREAVLDERAAIVQWTGIVTSLL